MFQPGDIVSYGTNGVCTITEKKRIRLAGHPCDCFILKPVPAFIAGELGE